VEVLYEIPTINLKFLTAIFTSRFSDQSRGNRSKNVLIIEEVVCHRTTLISGNETFGFSFPHEALTATLAMCLSDLREAFTLYSAASERDASMKLF